MEVRTNSPTLSDEILLLDDTHHRQRGSAGHWIPAMSTEILAFHGESLSALR